MVDKTVYRRMAHVPRSKADYDQILITQRICEAFQHQLRAVLIDARSLGPRPRTHIVLGASIQLISLRGATYEFTPDRVGEALSEFCNSRRYLLRLTRIVLSPGAVYPLDMSHREPGTLYLGKTPFTTGSTEGVLQTCDNLLAQKWSMLDEALPTVILYRDDVADITAWDKALNTGFWTVVAELRESPEWNAGADLLVGDDIRS